MYDIDNPIKISAPLLNVTLLGGVCNRALITLNTNLRLIRIENIKINKNKLSNLSIFGVLSFCQNFYS
jgi:hypothetical protein